MTTNVRYSAVFGDNDFTVLLPCPEAIPSEAEMRKAMRTFARRLTVRAKISDEGPILLYHTREQRAYVNRLVWLEAERRRRLNPNAV